MGNVNNRNIHSANRITVPAVRAPRLSIQDVGQPVASSGLPKDVLSTQAIAGRAKANVEYLLEDRSASHVHQYGEASASSRTNTREEKKEAQANCGPSSAAIVLKRMGITPPSLHEMRRQVGAPLGNQRRGAYAITTSQLIKMVEMNSENASKPVSGQVLSLPRSANDSYEVIRQALDLGKKVVLRTGNMENNGRGGHYVVVTSASRPPLRNLNIMDPQLKNGADHLNSFADFEKALSDRNRRGMPNEIIIFS